MLDQLRKTSNDRLAGVLRLILGFVFFMAGILKVVVPHLGEAFSGQLVAARIPFHDFNLYKLIEGEAEVLEIVISAESAAAGRLINQLHMPEQSIIGAVLRVDGEMVVPGGSAEILEGDTEIMVTLPDCIGKIEKIFGKKSSFLS